MLDQTVDGLPWHTEPDPTHILPLSGVKIAFLKAMVRCLGMELDAHFVGLAKALHDVRRMQTATS